MHNKHWPWNKQKTCDRKIKVDDVTNSDDDNDIENRDDEFGAVFRNISMSSDKKMQFDSKEDYIQHDELEPKEWRLCYNQAHVFYYVVRV